MPLSDVSRTALATLRSHAIESNKPGALIHDPLAEELLAGLEAQTAPEERAALFGHKLSAEMTNHFALRARKYDAIADEYIARHPGCTIVNLGCGFDTRYWRISHKFCTYIELDLPEVIDLKREILGGRLEYTLIGSSVLDPGWLEQVTPRSGRNVLLLAEGLFMYLPRAGVLALFKTFSKRLQDSQIALEVVTEQYTRGFWKQIVIGKIKRELGLEISAGYQYGVRKAAEIEGYARGLKILEEWAYVQDPDVRPKILKYLGLARTQWTVVVSINAANR